MYTSDGALGLGGIAKLSGKMVRSTDEITWRLAHWLIS